MSVIEASTSTKTPRSSSRKRMLPYRCHSPECLRSGQSTFSLEIAYYDSPSAECHKCGKSGHLRPCAVVHLIQPTERGIIRGRDLFKNPTGIRWEFLCKAAREGYRSHPKSPLQPKRYTVSPDSATCYECLLEFGAREVNGTLTLREKT